jgi:ribosomal protein S18 acetylase RimI-like enzyme
MTDATIRPATDVDLPALGKLGAALVAQHVAFDARRFIAPDDAEALYATFLRGQMGHSNSVVLVAERDGAVIGYVFASIEPPSIKELRASAGFIHDVLVDPSSRHGSVGSALVKAAIDRLRDYGADRVMLCTAEHNAGAQRLFTRLGFRRTMVEMTMELE